MPDRVDASGAAYAGSQLQTQLYVNCRRAALDSSIRAEFSELGQAEFEWTSPLCSDGYREYSDEAFLRRVGLGSRAAQLKTFWPSGGPHWDALAVVHFSGASRSGVLLVEGKSYPEELYGDGTRAKPGSLSRQRIEKSLGWTQGTVGAMHVTPVDWCGRLYQSANRLAHLSWLRSLAVPTWLVHALFTGDPHRATTAAEWEAEIRYVNEELGLGSWTLPGAAHILLPAGTRDELLAQL